jgi:hypothetical protein
MDSDNFDRNPRHSRIDLMREVFRGCRILWQDRTVATGLENMPPVAYEDDRYEVIQRQGFLRR